MSPYVARRRRAIAEVLATDLEQLIGPKPVTLFDEPVTERCGCGLPLVTAQERAYAECICCMKERACNG